MPVKMVKRISNITTERRGIPSTPQTLDNFTNYRGNYESQRAVRPTSWNGQGEWTTTNAGGGSPTFGVGTCAESGVMEYPRNDRGATKV
jgi:hypothetical protein